MRSELDTLTALAALTAIIVGVGLTFTPAIALIVGGTFALAVLVLVKRGES